MDFDIRQLDHLAGDSDGSEAEFVAFQEELLDRFAKSPEGQERAKADPGMGFWAAQLMYYGYQCEGKTLPRMAVGDVRTVVTDLFPRKISLNSPEEADNAVPELTAFWNYLKREFRLPQADAVLKFLREVEPDFPGMMNDSSNFGMAKSIFSMGHAAGFDMMTQEGLNAFMLAYNTGQLARQPQPRPSMPASFFGPSRLLDPAARKAERVAEKKRRKRAEEAKKRNRKQRK